MTERTYTEEEAREIFGLATSRQISNPAQPAAASGLTLDAMKEIGMEVGIAAEDVARAAATFDARAVRVQRSTSFGMPVGTGRVVPLVRAPTDLEWDRLVAELRDTFGAMGKVTVDRTSRAWTNGNLHALVEPVDDGYRLRLRTVKTSAARLNIMGSVGLLAGATIVASSILSGTHADIVGPAMLAAAGLGGLISNYVRLPRWARERETQMEYIAEKAKAMIDRPPATAEGQ